MGTEVLTRERNKCWTSFGDLEAGDFFVYDGDLFIKTMSSLVSETGNGQSNAIYANGLGTYAWFTDNTVIKYVRYVEINYVLGDKDKGDDD